MIWKIVQVVLLIASFFVGRLVRRQQVYDACESAVSLSAPNAPSAVGKNCSECKLPNVHLKTKMYLYSNSFPEEYFGHLHHPSTPAKKSFLLMDAPAAPEINDFCDEIYLTRTGSRSSQPNKCVAIVKIPSGHESIVQLGHRIGITALTLNQYQKDFPRDECLQETDQLLPPLFHDMDRLLSEFSVKMGGPVDQATGRRRTVVVMVANEGVMDLVLNFVCSAEAIDFNVNQIVVFVGNKEYVRLIESMGAQAIYSESLGSMPAQAAEGYLDHTFSRMMWFKTTSVYLALQAGFNVLFQDVDLVWMKDPLPYLDELEGDIIFMDDGARTPRYTPLFTNSGFYFMKYNPRTLYFQEKMIKGAPSEIAYSHSHQQVLTRHLAESSQLFGLDIRVLDTELFPSGQAYHENKKFVNKVIKRTYRPFVFHMCWTDNRVNKVVYFKEIGLWFLPEEQICLDSAEMLRSVSGGEGFQMTAGIRDRCCQRDKYWPKEINDKDKDEDKQAAAKAN